MMTPGHERHSHVHAKHMLLDIVDHGARGILLHKLRDQVPHTRAQAPHVLLERPLQLGEKDIFRIGTRIAQLNVVLATADSSDFVLDNHALNDCTLRGSA